MDLKIVYSYNINHVKMRPFCRNNLIIYGVPETNSEESPVGMVKKLIEKAGISIDEVIENAIRIPLKVSPRFRLSF